MRPSGPIVQASKPSTRTLCPVPPGPVFVTTTSHLGIDLGVTNLKWAALEWTHGEADAGAEGDWRTVDRGQIPTEAGEGPDAVVGRRLKPQDPGKPEDTRVLLVKVALLEPTPLKLGQRVEIRID